MTSFTLCCQCKQLIHHHLYKPGVAIVALPHLFNGLWFYMLASFLDANGMVDVGALRSAVEAGMTATGGDVLDIVPEIDPNLRLIGVTIKTIKITKDDFKDFFENTLPSVATPVA